MQFMMTMAIIMNLPEPQSSPTANMTGRGDIVVYVFIVTAAFA